MYQVIRDYYSGKDTGVNLIAKASLELDNFRKIRGCFGEVTMTLAAKVDPSQFWSVALRQRAWPHWLC
jgi:hypothetical protein